MDVEEHGPKGGCIYLRSLRNLLEFASADDAIYFTALPRGTIFLRLRYTQKISKVTHLLRNHTYYKSHRREKLCTREKNVFFFMHSRRKFNSRLSDLKI